MGIWEIVVSKIVWSRVINIAGVLVELRVPDLSTT